MKSNIQAIIFDMDGVIIDSEPSHLQAELQTCKDFGIDIPTSEWEGFKGRRAIEIFTFINDNYANGAHNPEELIAHKTRLVCALVRNQVKAIDGSMEFIKFISKKYKKIALATSTNHIVQATVFDKFGLHPYFSAIVTGTDVKHGKPHPEPYLLAAGKLEVQPSQAIVVEDSISGIKSAKSAGCQVLAITTSHLKEDLLPPKPDWIVDDYHTAKKIISTLDA
jgi:HAD superfamily hydrolase (TIGR01509 family)